MPENATGVLLFLSITGLLLSVILLYFNARKYLSSVYLGSFFFLVSLYAFIQYILVYSKSLTLATLFYIHPAFLVYLIGPMLYLYVRSVLADDTRFRGRDLWHGLPALVFLLAALPHFAKPWSEKTLMAARIIEDIGNIQAISTSLLYKVVPMAVVFISRPALVLAYTIASAILFMRWLNQRKGSAVLSQQRYMTQWLTILLGFTFILSGSQAISMTEAYLEDDLKIFFTLTLLQLLSGVGLSGLLIAPFFSPAILYGMPRFPEAPRAAPAGEALPGPVPPVMRPKQKPDFETDYLEVIRDRVTGCMEEFRPYLRADCNLAYLSKLTGIPSHHLAYYFREIKKQSFNDFRNEWRISQAKKLIREGKSKELTLEAIGLLSGFSTRNTFYTAFKKAEGISPGEFQNR